MGSKWFHHNGNGKGKGKVYGLEEYNTATAGLKQTTKEIQLSANLSLAEPEEATASEDFAKVSVRKM